MIFDHDGAEVGRHQLEHEQILPKAGWVEHNPVEIWSAPLRDHVGAELDEVVRG
jgi:glycerol kinase